MNKGFTLIELMIVVAILAIVATIALPSYKSYIENTKIRNGAESIQNGLQKARTEAVLKNASVIFTLGANSAWTVGCVTSNANCPAVIEERKAKDGSSNTVTVTPAAGTVTFTNLGTRATGGINQITLDNSALASADSRELRVTINGASVRMCDPNLAVGNLKAC